MFLLLACLTALSLLAFNKSGRTQATVLGVSVMLADVVVPERILVNQSASEFPNVAHMPAFVHFYRTVDSLTLLWCAGL